MLQIITDEKGALFVTADEKKRYGFNAVRYNVVEDTVIFLDAYDRSTIHSERLFNFTLNGETLTAENADAKLKEALFKSGGGPVNTPTLDDVCKAGAASTVSPEVPAALTDPQAVNFGQVKQMLAAIQPKTVTGDVSSTGKEISIGIENSVVKLVYKSATQTALRIHAKTGTVTGNGWIQETSALGVLSISNAVNVSAGTSGAEIADMATDSNNCRLLVEVFSTVGTAYRITAHPFNGGVKSTLTVERLI